jgi:hypothetical protein
VPCPDEEWPRALRAGQEVVGYRKAGDATAQEPLNRGVDSLNPHLGVRLPENHDDGSADSAELASAITPATAYSAPISLLVPTALETLEEVLEQVV